MQKTITTSPNVSVLDSNIIADLCTGKFFIDLTPTQWIASGASNVLGARIKITNPYDVAVKEYPSTGYDIAPPMTEVFQFNIPTEAGNFQYGLYVVTVELTDADGTKHVIFDNLDICQPNPKDRTKKFGIINAEILSDCKRGKVDIFINEPPVYKSKIYESKTQSFVMNYPSESTLPSLTSTSNGFSVPLFEGEYVVKGDACVTYNFGDNNFIKVPYKLNCKKKVYCIIDKRCIYNKIEVLNNQLDGCSGKEKAAATDVIFDALRLLKTIELGIEVGEDISIYIEEIEKLLDCKCTCSVSENTPVTMPSLSSNMSIEGCNVSKEVVGLTDVYTIENYEYLITTNPANNFVTVSAPTLTDCVKRQQLTFNVGVLYTALKGQVTTNAEYDFWASVVNNSIGGLTPELLDCLGITSSTWNAYTFKQKISALITKICSISGGVTCASVISNFTITPMGADMRLNWDANAATYYVDVYVDGFFKGTAIAPLKSFLLSGSGFQGKRPYKLIARCSNGAIGNSLDLDFTFNGCPVILPPTLSASSVPSAACPYNLNQLTPAAPSGFSVIWHNANNRLSSSLVANPAAVTSGTYYAFMVDNTTNCASDSSKVTVVCAVAGNCSEPLNLLVEKGSTGNVITFNSAATPPTSYLVKRKLSSATELAASYTTIGTPVFNAGTNKWSIEDAGSAINTSYTYKAESQCSDGGRPSAFFTFANIACPVVNLTSTVNSISYSFSLGTVNQISRVEAILYDEFNNVLDTDVFTPVFASPISGNFTSLLPNKTYKVGLSLFIGTYKQECSKQNIPTQEAPTANWSVQNLKQTVEAENFSFGINGTTAGSGQVAPPDIEEGFSNLIPTTADSIVFTLDGVNNVVTLNSVAADTVSGNIFTWGNITASNLNFVITSTAP